MMSEIPMRREPIGGLDSGVAVIGEGPAVVLLHGWGATSQAMWPVAQQLAQAGFTAHVLDLPGFGKTQFPPQPWHVPDYARWVVKYLDFAKLERAHLIGHSFGGRISLVLGADYAQRVNKIVLSNSAGVRLPPSLKQQVMTLGGEILMRLLSLPGLRSRRDRIRQRLRRRFASEDYLNAGPLEETFKLVIAEDLLPYARRVQASTLLFWGDQDQDTPLEAGRTLEREMPDAGLILIPGAGHYAYLDDLNQFIKVTVHFLKSDTAQSE